MYRQAQTKDLLLISGGLVGVNRWQRAASSPSICRGSGDPEWVYYMRGLHAFDKDWIT